MADPQGQHTDMAAQDLPPALTEGETDAAANAPMSVIDTLSAPFEVSNWVPLLAAAIAALGLLLAWWRWYDAKRETRRLAAILCASQLEAVAQRCLGIAYDYGTHADPEYHGINIYKDYNEATVTNPEIPGFESIDGVASLGTDLLNRLMSLKTVMSEMTSHLGHLWEFDSPDFEEGFERRRIFMTGYGEYCARLAKDIRSAVKAPPVTESPAMTGLELRQEMAALIGKFQASDKSVGRFAYMGETPDFTKATESLRTTYESIVYPRGQGFWPNATDIEKNRKANVIPKS